MSLVNIRITHTIEECKALWDQWSPRKSLYDLWEYRLPFWEQYAYEPAFVVVSENQEDVGLLPLWYQSDLKKYFWFGDPGDECNWQEDASFWIRDSISVAAVLEAAPHPLLLTAITPQAAVRLKEHVKLREWYPKSVLSLEKIQTPEQYLETLPKKLRQNIRRDWRRIDALPLTVANGTSEDFETLMELNARTFQDSPFHDEKLRKVFRAIVRNTTQNSYRTEILKAELEGRTVGVDCAFLWNGTYYPLLCGYDKEACPGIGHYMNKVDIEHAVALGASSIDMAEAAAGMLKQKLFPLVPQYVYSDRDWKETPFE